LILDDSLRIVRRLSFAVLPDVASTPYDIDFDVKTLGIMIPFFAPENPRLIERVINVLLERPAEKSLK